MNTQTTNILTNISSKELFKLTTEVKETLAVNVNVKSSFKAIDFWNLQRTQRARSCGRHMSISVR